MAILTGGFRGRLESAIKRLQEKEEAKKKKPQPRLPGPPPPGFRFPIQPPASKLPIPPEPLPIVEPPETKIPVPIPPPVKVRPPVRPLPGPPPVRPLPPFAGVQALEKEKRQRIAQGLQDPQRPAATAVSRQAPGLDPARLQEIQQQIQTKLGDLNTRLQQQISTGLGKVRPIPTLPEAGTSHTAFPGLLGRGLAGTRRTDLASALSGTPFGRRSFEGISTGFPTTLRSRLQRSPLIGGGAGK